MGPSLPGALQTKAATARQSEISSRLCGGFKPHVRPLLPFLKMGPTLLGVMQLMVVMVRQSNMSLPKGKGSSRDACPPKVGDGGHWCSNGSCSPVRSEDVNGTRCLCPGLGLETKLINVSWPNRRGRKSADMAEGAEAFKLKVLNAMTAKSKGVAVQLQLWDLSSRVLSFKAVMTAADRWFTPLKRGIGGVPLKPDDSFEEWLESVPDLVAAFQASTEAFREELASVRGFGGALTARGRHTLAVFHRRVLGACALMNAGGR